MFISSLNVSQNNLIFQEISWYKRFKIKCAEDLSCDRDYDESDLVEFDETEFPRENDTEYTDIRQEIFALLGTILISRHIDFIDHGTYEKMWSSVQCNEYINSYRHPKQVQIDNMHRNMLHKHNTSTQTM